MIPLDDPKNPELHAALNLLTGDCGMIVIARQDGGGIRTGVLAKGFGGMKPERVCTMVNTMISAMVEHLSKGLQCSTTEACGIIGMATIECAAARAQGDDAHESSTYMITQPPPGQKPQENQG